VRFKNWPLTGTNIETKWSRGDTATFEHRKIK
jgi:hypothetical protein